MAENSKILRFDEALAKARACDVTQDDIMNEQELAFAELCWPDLSMDAEIQAKLIRHERALDKFSKRAA